MKRFLTWLFKDFAYYLYDLAEAKFTLHITTFAITKLFSPSTIPVGGTSTLTITLDNSLGGVPVAVAPSLVDTLPATITIATPNGVVNGTNGTVTATSGTGSIKLSPEHIKNMAKGNTGVKRIAYKHKKKKELTNQHRAKISQNHGSSKVILNSQNGIFYDNIKEASKSFNIHHEYLRKKLNNKCYNNTPFLFAQDNNLITELYQLDNLSDEILNEYTSKEEAEKITNINIVSCANLGRIYGGYKWIKKENMPLDKIKEWDNIKSEKLSMIF